jgi:environmental stress-induced protein Ves
MKKLAADSFRAMPWKNGGGTTIEIARFPEGASLEDFDWRVSMARVEKSGPFSSFPGIDRSLAVLEGDGVVLALPGRGSIELDRASPPFVFPGDIEVVAELGVPTLDFNVMTRRGRARHLLSRVRVVEPTHLLPLGDVLVVVTLQGGVAVGQGQSLVRLGERDGLLVARGEAEVTLTPQSSAEIFAVDLWTLPRAPR